MPKKSKDLLRTYPIRGKAAVKLEPRKSLSKADTELLLKMYEATDLEALPADFLVLNGEVGQYGWQRVLQFAVYEKYNFFLPFLKLQLREKSFEELLEQGVLDDFVYVYCTMMTLMLNSSGGFYDPEKDEREYEAEYTDEQNRKIGAFRRDIDTFRARLRAVLTPAPTAAPSRAASSRAASSASRGASSTARTYDKGPLTPPLIYNYRYEDQNEQYEVYDVSQDGSCMFHAVFFGLKKNKGNKRLPNGWRRMNSGLDLRKALVDKVRELDKKILVPILCPAGMCKKDDNNVLVYDTGDSEKELYLGWLENSRHFTDTHELNLLAECFKLNITVYQDKDSRTGIQAAAPKFKPVSGTATRTVRIWYNGKAKEGGHYMYLVPVPVVKSESAVLFRPV
jgi:hypothetical protein